MDKGLIRRRFARAASTYSERADAQRRIAEQMTRLIVRYVPRSAYRNVLEVGCGTGVFTRMLLHRTHPSRLWLNDICPEMENCLTDVLNERIRFCAGDAEQMDFPGNQGLIASCSAVQWFDSPERFFRRCSDLLTDNGYFSFSTFGKQNLCEVASITGNALEYRSLEELKDTLRPHYELLHVSEELIHLSFPSPLDVLKHLQATGVTGVGSQRWTKGMLTDFCDRYSAAYRLPDRNVRLTYHPIYIIAKKIAS